MKQLLKKCLETIKIIYGYGIMIMLFVGGATFIGYLAAFIIGGSAAAAICDFIYLKIVPVMVTLTTSIVVFGMVCLYLPDEATKSSKRDEKSIPTK